MSGWPNISFRRHGLLLAGCLALAFAPGVIGSLFGPGAWYAELAKSALTPPGWVFPIAWTFLYITIGVALYLFLVSTPRPRSRADRGALVVFAIQLVLNGLWSWVFFGQHAIGAALGTIALLWLAIVGTIVLFARESLMAARLLLPYLAWVSFATYLNFAIWRLN